MESTQTLRQVLLDFQGAINRLSGQVLDVRQRLAAMEAADILKAQGATPRFPIEFRSQFGEDVVAWELLGRPTRGFFIEVGAFDGKLISVTYALEAMGWTGLLIEAIPERAQQCKVNRPSSRVVHAALAGPGSSGTTQFVLTNDADGGTLSYLNPESRHAGEIASAGITQRTITVPLTTMNALLSDHTAEIDLASIDVEGGELALLRGFDLARYRPKVLLLEDNQRGADTTLADYMARHPYTQVMWLEVNRVYLRNDLAHLAANVRR